MSQLSLDPEPLPFTPREKALAGFLAGWVRPGAGSFERLPRHVQDACLHAVRDAIRTVEEAAESR